MFSQFFLLTLYMQQVLHYTAIQTGVAFVTTTLAIIVFSNVGQMLVTRLGVRRVLTAGLVLTAISLTLLTRLPTDGNYFWSLFPAYLISGLGLALVFVPMTIAGLSGVDRADAGIASGLDQHEPADRRRGRPGHGQHDRGRLHGPRDDHGRGGRERSHPRVPGRVRRPDRTHRAGGARDGVLHRAGRAREATVEPVAVNSNELIEEAA